MYLLSSTPVRKKVNIAEPSCKLLIYIQDALSGTLETSFDTPIIPKYGVGGFPSQYPKVKQAMSA